jgi:hypothetical protein
MSYYSFPKNKHDAVKRCDDDVTLEKVHYTISLPVHALSFGSSFVIAAPMRAARNQP